MTSFFEAISKGRALAAIFARKIENVMMDRVTDTLIGKHYVFVVFCVIKPTRLIHIKHTLLLLALSNAEIESPAIVQLNGLSVIYSYEILFII